MLRVKKESLVERLDVDQFEDTVLSRALNRVSAIGPSGPWVAGGAVRRTLSGEKLDSDFDFFFASEEQANQFEEDLLNRGALLQAKNEKNSTYMLPSEPVEDLLNEDGSSVILPQMKIQVIKFQYYDSAEAVIDSFDFTLCQFAYDGEFVYMGDFSLWDLARKRLVPHKISHAVSSLRRLLKYTKQGYYVCSGGLAKILEDVAKDPSVINQKVEYID